jgi:predicted  nucleic acid-binding Zn-ribbon protein
MGSTNKTAGKLLLTADLAKLKADMQSAHSALEADRGQLKSDVQALRGTKPGKDAIAALKTALQQLRSSSQAERQDVKSAGEAATQALQALKASFKK